MRLLLVLFLVVACRLPDRAGAGFDWVNQDNGSSGSTEFIDGEQHSAANAWNYEQKPYFIGKGWLEWDVGGRKPIRVLWDREALPPLPPWSEPDPDPEHGEHGWVADVTGFLSGLTFWSLVAVLTAACVVAWIYYRKRNGGKREESTPAK